MLLMRYSMFGAAVVLGVLSVRRWRRRQAGWCGQRRGACQSSRRLCGRCRKLCAGVERGKGGGMRACFEAHEAELSAECKAARTERAAARAKERG